MFSLIHIFFLWGWSFQWFHVKDHILFFMVRMYEVCASCSRRTTRLFCLRSSCPAVTRCFLPKTKAFYPSLHRTQWNRTLAIHFGQMIASSPKFESSENVKSNLSWLWIHFFQVAYSRWHSVQQDVITLEWTVTFWSNFMQREGKCYTCALFVFCQYLLSLIRMLRLTAFAGFEILLLSMSTTVHR